MKIKRNSRTRQLAYSLFCFAALSFGTASVSAQDEKSAEGYVDNLKACQSIANDAERLSCYDSAVGRVVAATDQGEVQIVNKEDIRKTRRGLFGFSLPKIDLFGGDDDEEDLLQSVITDVRIQGRNTVFLTIEEGNAVWRIPSADRRVMRTRPGDTVEFKKASLGSYFIRINGRNGVKGRRVE